MTPANSAPMTVATSGRLRSASQAPPPQNYALYLPSAAGAAAAPAPAAAKSKAKEEGFLAILHSVDQKAVVGQPAPADAKEAKADL